MSFVNELRRRNVVRVAIVYGVASWLILQLADVFGSLLDLPAWTGKLVILLLALGLPVALVMSWVYEITPEGIARTSDVDGNRSRSAFCWPTGTCRATGRRRRRPGPRSNRRWSRPSRDPSRCCPSST
jgi:hypothetical protein